MLFSGNLALCFEKVVSRFGTEIKDPDPIKKKKILWIRILDALKYISCPILNNLKLLLELTDVLIYTLYYSQLKKLHPA